MKNCINDNYKLIWDRLKNVMGYSEGDDITYFDFLECCEDVDIDEDTINLEKFCEKYNVNIG